LKYTAEFIPNLSSNWQQIPQKVYLPQRTRRFKGCHNRTAHLNERKKMMQLWSDYLEGLKVGAKVLPLRAGL
jgi:hypothetical protein